MNEPFELPVLFNGKQFSFPGQLHLYGYSQKIEVLVNDLSILYERDEEGAWRALVDPSEVQNHKAVTVELLQAIADSIEEILK
jgi:hypothetical protein